MGSQQRGKLFTLDFYGRVTFNCKKKYFLDVLLSKELSEMLGYSKTDLETLSYKSQRDLIRSQVSRGILLVVIYKLIYFQIMCSQILI